MDAADQAGRTVDPSRWRGQWGDFYLRSLLFAKPGPGLSPIPPVISEHAFSKVRSLAPVRLYEVAAEDQENAVPPTTPATTYSSELVVVHIDAIF